jgi:hypothetical protein
MRIQKVIYTGWRLNKARVSIDVIGVRRNIKNVPDI